jgi:hypothetical protein
MRPTDLMSDKRLPGTKHTGPLILCNLARIWGFQLLSQIFPTIIARFSLPLVCAGSRTRRSMNGHLSPGSRAIQTQHRYGVNRNPSPEGPFSPLQGPLC